MIKTYMVAGVNWIAEVTLDDIDHLTEDQIKFEVCTRAVERHFGKRDDIPYQSHFPISLTEKQKTENELHTALIELLTTEIEPGCGIGTLLCIMDDQDPDTFLTGEDHEWYLSSKPILENVGLPSLVKSFDKKHSTKNKEVS